MVFNDLNYYVHTHVSIDLLTKNNRMYSKSQKLIFSVSSFITTLLINNKDVAVTVIIMIVIMITGKEGSSG